MCDVNSIMGIYTVLNINMSKDEKKFNINKESSCIFFQNLNG